MMPVSRQRCTYAVLLVAALLASRGIGILSAEDAASASLAEAPRILQPADYGVGRLVGDAAFTELAGKAAALNAFASQSALVLAWIDPTCPISNKFGPELARLESDFAGKGVALLLVAAPGAAKGDVGEFVQKYRLTSKVAIDSDGALARLLGATTTTEVFVLDRARTLRYRGAINDQYGLGYNKPAAVRT